MKKIGWQKFLTITLSVIVTGALLFFLFKIEKPNLVQGGQSENIRGWLWSATDSGYPGGIGWISLNC